ncbi:MAG TPA: conjugal transfer protein TraR [Bacteroidetes bacterium]|nr:conjugal transfer protein TraR [Ignavibacteria bacterium]HCA43820.1 conjugal transfer protein TraR [Bacteroidota bacterium]HCN37698.1 conjugal transfer protein TraR [Bacteroidota bacterium]
MKTKKTKTKASKKPKSASKKVVKKSVKKPVKKVTKKSITKPKSKSVKKPVKKVENKKLKKNTVKTESKVKKTKSVIKRATKPKKIEKQEESVVDISSMKKFKPNSKVRYTSKELKFFKDIILEERRKIIESAKANMRSLVDDESGEYVGDNSTYASHMAEQGTDEMEREKNYMFVQRDEKYLGYLSEALVRIDNGTYGVCIDCVENPKNLCKTCPLIDPERLELVPVTQHCIECKNLRG